MRNEKRNLAVSKAGVYFVEEIWARVDTSNAASRGIGNRNRYAVVLLGFGASRSILKVAGEWMDNNPDSAGMKQMRNYRLC
jgi:hypothetical protein